MKGLTARQRNIRNKNEARRASRAVNHRSHGEHLATDAPSEIKRRKEIKENSVIILDVSDIYYPGGAMTLALLLAARLSSAFWGHISDCDETYNYWEPLHYLVYGSGLQTWEYSPLYAVRSYMPLHILAFPAKILSYVFSPVTVFYCIRSLLAVLMALAEHAFYKGLCHEFGLNVARVWLGLTLSAAGCFAAASAMLPSAWSLALMSAALAGWWRQRYGSAVMFTAASAILSWPITAILGSPIAIDMIVIKRRYREFFTWAIIALIVMLIPTIMVDSWHYGLLVVTPWNNIFTEHGPDSYGVEPWTYYKVNLFLNFNVVMAFALYCCPVLVWLGAAERWGLRRAPARPRGARRAPGLSLMPAAVWAAGFSLQPHKEERFMYPIYNMIIVAAAITLDNLQKVCYTIGLACVPRQKWGPKKHHVEYTNPFVVGVIVVAAICGLSRITAVHRNYHGPMSILRGLPETPDVEKTVCFGKDWFRSPSSFHLAPGYRIRFIASEFKGQLPAPYDEGPHATRAIHLYFNNLNRGVNSTYLAPEQCDYLVDSDIGRPTDLQPAYHWDIVASVPIIDAEVSDFFFRAFYVPYLSDRYCEFAKLYLLKNKVKHSTPLFQAFNIGSVAKDRGQG